MTKEKQFVLVWLYGGKPFPIITGCVQLVASTKKKLKLEPQYKKGLLITRSESGFLANPLWTPNKKKKSSP